MESDSLRTRGDSTLAEMWIDGKVRAVTITREAIETFLRLPADRAMTDEERREFVRSHLTLVAEAAKAQLRATDPGADAITIDAGGLAGDANGQGDRRQGDRRKGERRKLNLGPPPSGERRRAGRSRRDPVDK
jgi:hypothetical protein